MLTLKKIGVSVGAAAQAMAAARYVVEFADSPQAFARDDGDPGAPVRANAVWLGSDSALGQLGLERGTEVSAEQLALALQGLHTETGAEVRRPGPRDVPVLDDDGKPVLDAQGKPLTTTELRVNSVDLTFSAPKSVSVVWSQAGPELRHEIEQAMLDAANATLEYMTRTKPVVQTKGGGEPAVGFAASAALHVTARTAKGDVAPAPQLHVHGTLVGVEAAGGGRLRSPGTGALFKNDAPLAGGALGRAVLAERLRGIGFGIEWGTGRDGMYFEIAGVPTGLIERMSPRAREVERERVRRELAKGERLTGPDLALVALETRGSKTNVAPEVTAERWKAQGQEFEFEEAAVNALAAWEGQARDPDELLADARAAILQRIWQRGPTVSSGEAEAIAYAVAPMGLGLDEVTGLLRYMERSGELIGLEGGRVTTREIRSLETRVMRAATRAARTTSTPLSDRARATGREAADRALGEGKSLDPEQQRAFEALTAGKGWGTLTGRAGTGKGPVLQAVAEAHRADGWRVIACAVDGSTAQRLGHQIEDQALTIEQVINRTVRGRLRVDDRTLILIEEASKVGLADWARITRLVEQRGARVIAVGHTGQLGAIELPGMFAEMLRHETIPTQELTEIRRHRHKWMRDYQVALDTGDAERAVKLLHDNDAVVLRDTRIEAMGAMVADWDRQRRVHEDPRSAIMVVHGSNDDVDLVNELAQAKRLATGTELTGEGIRAPDRNYRIYAGDVVMVREAAFEFEPRAAGARAPRVENGTIGIVDQVDLERDRVWVNLNEPGVKERLVAIDLAKLRHRGGEERVAALRLAYAFHPFPLQGATVEDVFVLEGDRSQKKEATYVADTRARRLLRKYLDRESLGTERTDDERWEQYIKRLRKSQNRSASISLEETGEPIAADLPPFAAAPEFPTRAGGRERGQSPNLENEPDLVVPVVSGDPIEAHRRVLGEERTRQLENRAGALGKWLDRRDEAWLRARVDELGAPFEHLDRAGALEALRLERDRNLVTRRINDAMRHAGELKARAAEVTGLGRREARDNLLAEARTERGLAGRDMERLRGIAGAEEQLREDGRHPDEWLALYGESAARAAALERELAVREQEREGRERAAEPPVTDRELAVELAEAPAIEP